MQQSLSFLDFQLSLNKIKLIPNKCDYLCSTKPIQKEDILSISGTLNFFSKFIPNYAEETEDLRKLTHKSIKFV